MTVVYEDNHIIIVNKTASEIVQGDKTGDTPLSETVKQYLKEKYNKYLDEHEISGASFSRDALDYWMSVDGQPETVPQQIHDLQKENKLLRELLAEKERTIQILQGQIERIDGTRPSPLINVNGNRNVTAVNKNDE